jgi:hypothetical protein
MCIVSSFRAGGAEPGDRDLAVGGQGEAGGGPQGAGEGAEGRVVHVGHRAAPLADGVMVAVVPGQLVEPPALAEVGAAGDAGVDQHVERPVDGGRVHGRMAFAGPGEDLVGRGMVAAAQCLKDQQALGGGTTSGLPQDGDGGIQLRPLGSYLRVNRTCGRPAIGSGHRGPS